MFRRLSAAVKALTSSDQPKGRKSKQIRIKGAYDAASTNERDAKWWANADSLSARNANSPAIRKRLRERARYEAANNCYAGGIAKTLSDDTIGSGPMIQIHGIDREDATFAEREFMTWCKSTMLADKLRIMRRARIVDGESLLMMITNENLPSTVKIDTRLVETEQLCQPYIGKVEFNGADGIEYDKYGNPSKYHILKDTMQISASIMDWDAIPASQVIHDFRPERAGQVRGIPEMTAALPLFKLLRAYTLATLRAAEKVATFAMVAYTDSPGTDEGTGADEVEAGESLPLDSDMMTAMPRGWKLGQVKPEQPASTFKEFKREIVAEIGRIFSMPFIVAAGDSSDSSYATGRMDYQCYHRAIFVDRTYIENTILERLFKAWLTEAILIEGYLPQSLRSTKTKISYDWIWDGWEHVDPSKEANAQETRLKNHTTTLADEYSKTGKDWEEQLELIAKIKARQNELAEKYGISWDPPAPAQQQPNQKVEDEEEVKTKSDD